jgi:stress response protein SCP2
MVTRFDYQKDAVDACFSVMLEVMTILGEFRDHIVLIGGWVPYFLLQDKQREHTGSLDIDLAFDSKKISDQAYRTILQLLKQHQYRQGAQPFIFYREVESALGKVVRVQVDLLSGEYGGTGRSHRTQKIQDARARKARGSDLVFEDYSAIKISGKMPDGAENEISIKIANVVPFLVMKGMVLWETYKEKHAYDIYFVVRNFPGGIAALADQFEPLLSNRLVQEGLGKIRSKFANINSIGPKWIANFEELDDQEQKELLLRDAFERVNALLDQLKISPYSE